MLQQPFVIFRSCALPSLPRRARACLKARPRWLYHRRCGPEDERGFARVAHSLMWYRSMALSVIRSFSDSLFAFTAALRACVFESPASVALQPALRPTGRE